MDEHRLVNIFQNFIKDTCTVAEISLTQISLSNEHRPTLTFGSSDFVILSTHPSLTILQHSLAVLRASSIPAASGVMKK